MAIGATCWYHGAGSGLYCVDGTQFNYFAVLGAYLDYYVCTVGYVFNFV